MTTSILTKLIRRSPLRWQFANGVTHVEVIQRVINNLGARRYLEIGVSYGTCFCSIAVPEKIGVDPISPSPAISREADKPGVRYFAQTSDDFFAQAAPQVLADGVDVVFIDGLHTYPQAYRDFINSLDYLSSGGVILVHDCLPASELEARVAKTYDDALRLNSGSAWDGEWVGDVWKVILRLRAERTDLQICVLHCDHGIGVIYRAQNESRLSYAVEQIEAMTFSDLAMDRARLLNLRAPKDLTVVLEKLKSKSSGGASN